VYTAHSAKTFITELRIEIAFSQMTIRLKSLAIWLLLIAFCARTTAAAETSNPETRLEVSDRTVEPLIKVDKPWEDWCLGYCQVIREGKQWRMWYASFDHKYRNDADCYLCYATSADGVHWEKPDLGLIEYQGSKHNNLLLHAGVVGASVFVDDHAPTAERYKMAFVKFVDNRWPVFGGTSPDGIHWTLGDKALLDYNSDTQQSCFPDGNGYRLYVRMWNGPKDFSGSRIVGMSYSPTYGDFPLPGPVLEADDRDPTNMQFYNSAVTKVRDGLYLMLPSGFYKGEDVSRVHSAISRDGVHFRRVGPRPLLDLGKSFDRKALYLAPGAVPTGKPGEFWVYYVGSAAPHDQPSSAEVKRAGGIGRFRLKISEK
jgi:hypothetical protein